MVHAMVRRARDTDEGFSMIELLVVIIIIGILAAIAIPVFLQQRKKGYDAAVKSDLVGAANAEEAYLTDNNTYTDSASALQTAESADHRVEEGPGLLHHRGGSVRQHVVLRQWCRRRTALQDHCLHLLGGRRLIVALPGHSPSEETAEGASMIEQHAAVAGLRHDRSGGRTALTVGTSGEHTPG
jgi:prepilin-type N-terminal cleavage/methylation domain-containing protein